MPVTPTTGPPADVDLLDSFAAATDNGEPAWQESALCAQTDPDLWFPEMGGSAHAAKRICSRCDVQAECLAYALAHDERFGIYGGTTPGERHDLLRQAG